MIAGRSDGIRGFVAMARFSRLLVVLLGSAAIGAGLVPPASARALPPPTEVSASAGGNSRVTVFWRAARGATSYEVVRGVAPDGPRTPVGTTTATVFADTTVAPGTHYFYAVRSRAGSQVSRNSEEVGVAVFIDAPADAYADADVGQVDLTWEPSRGALSYGVERRAADGTVRNVGTATGTSFTDPTVAAHSDYQYRVCAAGPKYVGCSRNIPVYTGRRTVTELDVSPPRSESGQRLLYTVRVRPADGSTPRFTGTVDYFLNGRPNWWETLHDGWTETHKSASNGMHRAEFRGDKSAGLGSSSSAPVSHMFDGPDAERPRFRAAELHELAPDSRPTSTGAADVTGDGRLDVLMTTTEHISSADDYKLWVLAQRPDGTLAEPRVLDIPGPRAATLRIATGDVDADGDADVAVSGHEGVFLFRQGGGGLEPPVLVPVEGKASDRLDGDVRLVDMNADRRADLVVAGVQHVVVVPSRPDGTFGPAVPVATGEWGQVEAADVTGDGRPDVVARDRRRTWFVYAQTDGGGFVERWRHSVVTPAHHRLEGMAVGDVTGDRRADILVTLGGNIPTSRYQVYAQQAGGGFGPAVTSGAYHIPGSVTLADLNGDDRQDAVIAHGQWLGFAFVLQRRDGRLGADNVVERLPYPYPMDLRGVTVGDVSGDGRPDVLMADSVNGLAVIRQT
jgi:hypothetical protein